MNNRISCRVGIGLNYKSMVVNDNIKYHNQILLSKSLECMIWRWRRNCLFLIALILKSKQLTASWISLLQKWIVPYCWKKPIFQKIIHYVQLKKIFNLIIKFDSKYIKVYLTKNSNLATSKNADKNHGLVICKDNILFTPQLVKMITSQMVTMITLLPLAFKCPTKR